MARKRASMREGPLAELFRATEAAQKQAEGKAKGRKKPQPAEEPAEQTVEHVPTWEESVENVVPPPAPAAGAEEAPAKRAEAGAGAGARARVAPGPRSTRCPRRRRGIYRAPRGDAASYLAVIRVVGVGGAGLNALHRMMDAGVTQVEFIAVNTDIQQLQMSDAQTKIHIGQRAHAGARLRRRSRDRPPRGRGGLRPDQDTRCAAATWCSSPPARAAAPAPAPRPSSRGSRARSAR